jgi:hypothetical protein
MQSRTYRHKVISLVWVTSVMELHICGVLHVCHGKTGVWCGYKACHGDADVY